MPERLVHLNNQTAAGRGLEARHVRGHFICARVYIHGGVIACAGRPVCLDNAGGWAAHGNNCLLSPAHKTPPKWILHNRTGLFGSPLPLSSALLFSVSSSKSSAFRTVGWIWDFESSSVMQKCNARK